MTGTPAQMYSTMERCWSLEPTSNRIIEDIYALPYVLQKIVDARGCIVPDENFRRGRRRVRQLDERANSTKCLRASRSRQSKSTLVAKLSHADREDALEIIQSGRFDLESEADDTDASTDDSGSDEVD